MSINDTEDVLHRIRIRLHSSNLPHANGGYYSRTASEKELSIEDVSVSAVNRGGAVGSSRNMALQVRQFFDELAYLLCDGYAVNTGYFSLYPVVQRFFETEHEGISPQKHPVSFRFRTRAPLRELAKHIVIEVEEPANTCGRIEVFTDESGAVNKTVTPGALFSIKGSKIKVTGSSPDCGIWFVSKANPSRRYRASRNLSVNTPSKLAGIAPALPGGDYTVDVTTQYTRGGINLKEPRTVKSGFTLVAGKGYNWQRAVE
ncbi:MAG: DUF4469 domain-containing protein [Treponema sp.]|jgi:hypothetical protein|nr:DUF4469 domain-containing protein [Treponema sp.]